MLSVTEALDCVIKKPLGPRDLKKGFIYIFWEVGQLGMVKIGYTDNRERRLKHWSTCCKREYAYHKATSDNKLAEIPHMSRVEELMHIELKEYQRVL